uniref:transposase n=1 Tax=Candidatus Enterovibrio altilux TaxID=1927128 RepID=UPI001CC243D6|nr:transposase [Candidatus Enterovibrio luxaltus]
MKPFSNLIITMFFMIKHVFAMLLKGLQEFIKSVFKFVQLPLSCPHYSCISKRAKMAHITFKTKTREIIQHLVINSTGDQSLRWRRMEVKKHAADSK